jgi:SpoVK/Ycf46/Vps4 family AAA+-type ATPase
MAAESVTKMLRDIELDPTLDVELLAASTQGYSGSGLKELCRAAVSVPVREQMKRLKGKTAEELKTHKSEVSPCSRLSGTGFIGDVQGIKLRPLKFSDFGLNSRLDLD